MNRGGKIAVDTALLPSDAEVELPSPSDVRGWQWVPKECIAWQGHATDGIRDVCDREGRFILVRDDGYMVTNRTFSLAGDFSEQSAPVYINGRGATFITDFGDLLNNRWFDGASGYHEGSGTRERQISLRRCGRDYRFRQGFRLCRGFQERFGVR